MFNYQHILIATDSCEVDSLVLQRALMLYEWCQPKMTIIHVLEHVPVDIPVEVVPPEGEDKVAWMKQQAKEKLVANCQLANLGTVEFIVETGVVKSTIIEFAKELGVDLIVVGAHERHGLALLTPSTTDGIVHAAPCDVLAVHSEKH